jgi:hypothetical protein
VNVEDIRKKVVVKDKEEDSVVIPIRDLEVP